MTAPDEAGLEPREHADDTAPPPNTASSSRRVRFRSLDGSALDGQCVSLLNLCSYVAPHQREEVGYPFI